MAKDSDAKSGRVAFDQRGCSTCEWRIDTGTFNRAIDTHRLRQLQEEAAVTLRDEPVPPPAGVDLYSVTNPLAVDWALNLWRQRSRIVRRAATCELWGVH